MKRLTATILGSLAACAFAMLCFVMPAEAKEVTVNATPNKDTYLNTTVSYDDEFKFGETKTFTFNVTNNNDTLKYKIFSFKLNGEGVIDISKYPYKDYTTDNHFNYTFHSPGKYELTFLAADGNSGLAEFLRFTITFSVEKTGEFKDLNTYVEEVAKQCIDACGNSNQYSKALWLNDWIISNSAYDNDMQAISAYSLFAEKKGTCEAYHKAYCLLLNKVGIETRRVNSSKDDHVWTGAKLDGQWYNIDTTWNDARQTSSSYPDVQHLYFALPSSIMLLGHQGWDGMYEVSYPQRAVFDAQSYACNYFIRSGEISKYTNAFLASTGERSVKTHLDAKETNFSIPIENTAWPPNYKNVIYSLVAYQLSQTDWGSGIDLTVSYSNESSGNETLEFQAVFDIPNSSISITDATVLGTDSMNYSGQSLAPDFVVLVNDKLLAKGRDYEITYTNNTDAGTASVEITGKGKYTGKVTKTFKINPFAISSTNISSIVDQQYTGKALTPAVQVSHNGKQLTKDTDYTIKYENNTNAGTAKITLTGKGNYTGTATVNFTIIKTDSGSSSSGSSSSSSSSSTKPGSNSSSTSGSNTGSSSTSGSNNSSSTATPSTTAKVTGTWIKSGSRWWFKYDNRTKQTTKKEYPRNEFVSINNVIYHFDSAGWMHTGWQKLSGTWYYFNGFGAMTKGWQYVGGAWYHLGTDGKMKTGWHSDSSGKYYLTGSGAMKTGWFWDGSNWYYFNGSGAMAKGWQYVGGAWYFMQSDGKMLKNWFEQNGVRYYLNSSGAMATGWCKINNIWYYFNGSGAMVKNRWIGNYWLQSDGTMATNKWVDNDRYFVDANGAWVKNAKH